MAEDATLAALLSRRARERPHRPFLRMSGAEYTYERFNATCNRLAHGLAALGVSAGDLVTVMLANSPQFVFTWLALGKLGAVEAAINSGFRGAGLASTLELAASRVVVTEESFLEPLASVRGSLAGLETLVIVGRPGRARSLFPECEVRAFEDVLAGEDGDPEVSVRASDLGMLLFTSGTTGRSKACMLPHSYAVHQGELMARHLELRQDDVLYTPFPLFHIDAATLTVAPAIVLGATAALGTRFSASGFWPEVRSLGATVFDFMGATLTMLWKQPPAPDDREHAVRLAWGVPLPAWAAEFEGRFGLDLVEVYGSTDAGVCIFQPLGEPRRSGSCGRAVFPYEIRIFDDQDREVPPGETGEMVIRSERPWTMMQGYYRMPEETVAAFRNLWFHTGDLAYRDEDGWFYFVGRTKDMIRRRGENVSAFEVEEVVTGHPAVLEAAAVGVPSELTEEDVKVLVVLRPGHRLDPRDLIDYCEQRMARFMVPRYVEFLDALPRTPTEKVEKHRLREAGVTAATWDRQSAGEDVPGPP